MKVRITVEVEISNKMLGKEYGGDKLEETLGAYAGKVPDWYKDGVTAEELRMYFARDVLDRCHGMRDSLKSFRIVENVLVSNE